MAEVKTVNDDAKLPLQAATTSISEEVEKLINEHKMIHERLDYLYSAATKEVEILREALADLDYVAPECTHLWENEDPEIGIPGIPRQPRQAHSLPGFFFMGSRFGTVGGYAPYLARYADGIFGRRACNTLNPDFFVLAS